MSTQTHGNSRGQSHDENAQGVQISAPVVRFLSVYVAVARFVVFFGRHFLQ
jgi:hypothetical protein